MAARYDSDRLFLERIRDTMLKNIDELQARQDELQDQVDYLEHAISALHVYERVNPISSEVPYEKA